ncbi:MAG: DNA repair protein RecO [Dehalococcoidia bacterium]
MTSGRARLYKTECIVLSRRNIGEADSILTVFSPDHGRFDGIARGVRKARSRMRGHLEPLTRTQVMLAAGRTLDVFTQAEAVAVYRNVREDLDRYAAAVYASELVRRMAPEHESQPWLYAALADLLDLFESGARLTVLLAFETRLLEGTGVGLQVGACAACSAALPAADAFYAPGAGGLLCDSCRRSGEPGRLVSLRAVKVLRHAARSTLSEFAALRMDDTLQREVESVLGDAVRFALDDEPRSSGFLREVRSLYHSDERTAAPGATGVESTDKSN